ncbi:MAG TPA: peptide chain release factor-like protein, partial [Micromonosporaceae bacterium]
LRYAERQGWVTEMLDSQESDLGGYKDISIAIKTKGVPEGGYGIWSRLKWEGGVHRVQRVPATESQGRIHTSAAGVLVIPDVEETEVTIEEKDLRVDVFRSSGPGGQSVNTTDSAVRITHVPTGIVVSCQNERSQLQNKDRAMRMLRAKLGALYEEQAASAAADQRKSQVRTVDRSERIRTYNYPQNRVSDHRIGYTAYNLDLAMAGDMDGVLDALTEADRAARLAGEDHLSRQ